MAAAGHAYGMALAAPGINYAVGIGLYMIPSNLFFQVGVIQKYNNNLVIADDSTEIGKNEDINPLDSAAAVNPIPEQHSTRISPAEIETGIAFVVFILFLTGSSQ